MATSKTSLSNEHGIFTLGTLIFGATRPGLLSLTLINQAMSQPVMKYTQTETPTPGRRM